jgi:hypothetical protein
MTTAITGKQFTVEVDGESGSAQITTGTIDESASSETIQTLAGSAAVSQGVESTISCDFLFDGNVAGGGFYAVMKAALAAGVAVPVTIDGGGASWAGDAIVTSLSTEFPADGASTCSGELTVSGELPFTAPVAP